MFSFVGISCSFDVIHGGLGIKQNCKFLLKMNYNIGHQNPLSGFGSGIGSGCGYALTQMLDPIRIETTRYTTLSETLEVKCKKL
jgi:hypothetical protein